MMKNYITLFLAALSASFFFLRDIQLVCFADLSLITEYAYRIFLGQRPYVDFGLVLSPGSFWVQSLLMKLHGFNFQFQHYYVVAEGFLSVLLVGYSLKVFRFSSAEHFLLLAPLFFLSLGSIDPLVDYDYDSALLALVSIASFLKFRTDNQSWAAFVSGVSAGLVFFFKQSTGTGFAVGFLLVMASIYFIEKDRASFRKLFFGFISGILINLIFFLSLVGWDGLEKAYAWIIQYAANTRAGGFKRILNSFKKPEVLVSVLPWSLFFVSTKMKSAAQNLRFKTAIRFSSFAVPFIAPLIYLLIKQDVYIMLQQGSMWVGTILFAVFFYSAKILKNRTASNGAYVSLLCICFALSAFASHGALGSHHACWPFFILVWASVLNDMTDEFESLENRKYLIWIFCGTFLPSSYAMIQSNIFMKLTVPHEQSIQAATLPNLQGLRTAGTWVPEFEGLIKWTKENIPQNESVISLPGEDPFYAASERKPQLSLFLLIPGGFPFTIDSYFKEIEEQKIRWVILKTHLQLPDQFFDLKQNMNLLLSKYRLQAKLDAYEIYRRVDEYDQHP